MERKRSVRRRQKRPFAERAKDHCRSFTAFLFSNVGIIILVVLYMTAGASMFIAIEGDESIELWNEVKKSRGTLIAQLWNVSSNELNGLNRSMYNEEINKMIYDYQKILVKAAREGYLGDDGSNGKNQEQWSFSGAFLYSLTVITTIGYGNISPRTEWGKVATILYAIIGMPLFLLYLSNIGDILAKSFKWIYAKVCLCRICPGVAKRRALRERRKLRALTNNFDINDKDLYSEEASETISTSKSSSTQMDIEHGADDTADSSTEAEDTTQTVTVPITICLMIMIGYILLGATIFGKWEEWDILDGCYFCFISLSSIGFGDIVPGDKIMQISVNKQSGVELRFILCAVYLLLGMALIAMCFNLMQEEVIYKIRAFKRGIRRCFRCDR